MRVSHLRQPLVSASIAGSALGFATTLSRRPAVSRSDRASEEGDGLLIWLHYELQLPRVDAKIVLEGSLL